MFYRLDAQIRKDILYMTYGSGNAGVHVGLRRLNNEFSCIWCRRVRKRGL